MHNTSTMQSVRRRNLTRKNGGGSLLGTASRWEMKVEEGLMLGILGQLGRRQSAEVGQICLSRLTAETGMARAWTDRWRWANAAYEIFLSSKLESSVSTCLHLLKWVTSDRSITACNLAQLYSSKVESVTWLTKVWLYVTLISTNSRKLQIRRSFYIKGNIYNFCFVLFHFL